MAVATPTPRIGKFAAGPVSKRPTGKPRHKPRRLPAPKPAMQPMGLINR